MSVGPTTQAAPALHFGVTVALAEDCPGQALASACWLQGALKRELWGTCRWSFCVMLGLWSKS